VFGIIAGMRRTVLGRDEGNGFRTVGAGATEPVFDRWVVITFGSSSPEAIFSVEGFGRPTFFGQELQGGIVFIGNEPGFYFRKPEILFTFVGKKTGEAAILAGESVRIASPVKINRKIWYLQNRLKRL
jgi:hypothetical protein